MWNNFINYGKETTIDLTDTSVYSYDDINLFVKIENDFIFKGLYLSQKCTVLTVDGQHINSIIVGFNYAQQTVAFRLAEKVNMDFLETLILNTYKIESGNYKKLFNITDVKILGQKYDAQLHFKLLIETDKPKFVKIYKYIVKYKEVTSNNWSEVQINTFEKDSFGNDIINLVLNVNSDILFKVSAYYLNNEISDATLFSNRKQIKLADVTNVI